LLSLCHFIAFYLILEIKVNFWHSVCLHKYKGVFLGLRAPRAFIEFLTFAFIYLSFVSGITFRAQKSTHMKSPGSSCSSLESTFALFETTRFLYGEILILHIRFNLFLKSDLLEDGFKIEQKLHLYRGSFRRSNIKRLNQTKSSKWRVGDQRKSLKSLLFDTNKYRSRRRHTGGPAHDEVCSSWKKGICFNVKQNVCFFSRL